MPDKNRKFHEFALKSILFKGRSDWYFCYLKAEKIAHVLAVLASRSEEREEFDDLVRPATTLTQMITHFVAGEVDLDIVLADIFALLSAVRLFGTRGLLSQENTRILCAEYEQLAEKLAPGGRLSPILLSEDFSVPQLSPEEATPLLRGAEEPEPIKDTKRQGQRQTAQAQPQEAHSKRMSLVLELVRKYKRVSIKDLSSVIKDCSEKTIQRELASLIAEGLVRKEGERRWSVYIPV